MQNHLIMRKWKQERNQIFLEFGERIQIIGQVGKIQINGLLGKEINAI